MKKNKKKVFITGATGFIGSHLARRLVREGFEVNVLARKTSDWWRLKDIKKELRVYFGDIEDLRGLEGILKNIRPMYIFHLANAGLYGGKPGPEDEQVRVNLIGTMNLIKAAGQIDYKAFINSGSSAEYGVKDKPMKETDFCAPDSVYAVTKLAATRYAAYVGRRDKKPLVSLRVFSPFGPADEKGRLISAVIVALLRNRAPKLADPKAVRDYIYVEDLADLYLTAAKKIAKLSPGLILNAGTGNQKSAKQAVDSLAGIIKPDVKMKWGMARSRSWESSCWQADMSRAKKLLNWRPKYSFKEGLAKTVDWFRENKNQYK